MKKLGIGLIVASVAALTPTVVHATDTTAASEVPDKCIAYWTPPEEETTTTTEYDGPTRNVHYTTYDYPDCDDVEGICVEIIEPERGPSRAVHRPQGDEDPCVPIDESCGIVFDLNKLGASRAVHQATQRPKGESAPPLDIPIDIPAECEEALSEALVPAGSDSGTIIWLAALFVGLGGAMLVTRRAVAIRTR
jgi:hypothetical protein